MGHLVASHDRARHVLDARPYRDLSGPRDGGFRLRLAGDLDHVSSAGIVSPLFDSYFAAAAARQTRGPESMHHSMHHAHAGGSALSFPYVFPQSGAYRVWVQAKTHGDVITAVFDLA
jgi:hypothetical protein